MPLPPAPLAWIQYYRKYSMAGAKVGPRGGSLVVALGFGVSPFAVEGLGEPITSGP